MTRRIGRRVVRAAAAFVVAFDAIALVTGYIGVGTAPKLAGLVIAGGVGIWLYRDDGGRPDGLPRVWEVALLFLLAGTIGFAAAWWSERDSEPSSFAFVAVPRDAAALVSLAPQPNTEVERAGILTYGTQLRVRCYVRGSDAKVWYQLDEGYFVSERDVKPAPLSRGDPPNC